MKSEINLIGCGGLKTGGLMEECSNEFHYVLTDTQQFHEIRAHRDVIQHAMVWSRQVTVGGNCDVKQDSKMSPLQAVELVNKLAAALLKFSTVD